jgi:hypothetical protein
MASICCSPLCQDGEVSVDLIEERLPPRLGHAPAVETGAQVFHDAEQAEDAAVFGHVGDAQVSEPVGRQPRDLPAVEAYAALGGADEPHDGLERRALAHAVATQQPHDLPGSHLEGNPVEDVRLAVVGVDVLEGQDHVLR